MHRTAVQIPATAGRPLGNSRKKNSVTKLEKEKIRCEAEHRLRSVSFFRSMRKHNGLPACCSFSWHMGKMQEAQQWFLSMECKSIPMLPYQTHISSSYEQPVAYQCKQVWIPLPTAHSDFSCRLEIYTMDCLVPKLLGAEPEQASHIIKQHLPGVALFTSRFKKCRHFPQVSCLLCKYRSVFDNAQWWREHEENGCGDTLPELVVVPARTGVRELCFICGFMEIVQGLIFQKVQILHVRSRSGRWKLGCVMEI